jgi:hypothetical protein
MGPKAGSILAHPPVLGLKSGPPPGGRQPHVWQAVRAVFVVVEAREVRAADLVGPIALDPLRAEVPVGRAAFGVERGDGLVGDAAHQQTQLLLAVHRFRAAFHTVRSRVIFA